MLFVCLFVCLFFFFFYINIKSVFVTKCISDIDFFFVNNRMFCGTARHSRYIFEFLILIAAHYRNCFGKAILEQFLSVLFVFNFYLFVCLVLVLFCFCFFFLYFVLFCFCFCFFFFFFFSFFFFFFGGGGGGRGVTGFIFFICFFF